MVELQKNVVGIVGLVVCLALTQMAVGTVVAPPIEGFTTADASKDIVLGPASVSYSADMSSYSVFAGDIHSIAGYYAGSGGWADIQHEDQAGLWSAGPYAMLGRGASANTAWIVYKCVTAAGYVTDAGGAISAHMDFTGNPATQGNNMWVGVNDTMTLGIAGGGLFSVSNAGDFDKVTMLDTFGDNGYSAYHGDVTLDIPVGVSEFYVVLADAGNTGYMAYTSLQVDAVLVPEPASLAFLGLGFLAFKRSRK